MSRSTQKRLQRRIEELVTEFREGKTKDVLTVNSLELNTLIRFLELCVEKDLPQAVVFQEVVNQYLENNGYKNS